MHIILIIVGVLVVCIVVFFIAYKLFSARMQHYQFAHQLLPKQLFAEPVAVLVPMVSATGFSNEGREHLLRFWEAAGQDYSGQHLVASDSLTYSMVVLGHPNSTAFLIELPPPVKKPEAFFTLMVFDAPGLTVGTVRHLRYFTLEFHGNKNGIAKTWLSEWKPKADGNLEYVDHGEGPAPDKGEFMARVQQIIEASGSQP
jgi:hypothetical protein